MSKAIMKRLFSCFLITAFLSALAAGCGGGDKDKWINSSKDRPKAAPKKADEAK